MLTVKQIIKVARFMEQTTESDDSRRMGHIMKASKDRMITLRVSADLHEQIAREADRNGTSINAYCIAKIFERSIQQNGKVRGRRSRAIAKVVNPDD